MQNLMNASQAAEYLGISQSALAKMRMSETTKSSRMDGPYPAFVKMGRRVAYRQHDLDCWIELRLSRPNAKSC